jgi:MFS family permease
MPIASLAKTVPFRGVASPRLKLGVFVIEGINSLATTYAFFYIYFLAEKQYGFGALQNFLLAAALGAIYMVAAIFGGRFAQKRGYFFSLQFGISIMIAGFLAASQLDRLWPRLAMVVVAQIGMCFTWPALQGLLSEGEPPIRLQGLVGWYNCTWAVAGAFGYFTGGAMLSALGMRSIFLVPAGLLAVELVLAFWLAALVGKNPARLYPNQLPVRDAVSRSLAPTLSPQTFLKMAWLANPFAYLAINTVIAAVPTIAVNLGLTPKMAGFICSIWMFVRAGSFVLLRYWSRWHYRFRFLAAAYIAMIICFALILLVPNLWVLIGAQIVFGLAGGLVYYSSLFYSLDVGETKGEHGGIHEAAIGAGSCGGPAIAAGTLYFLPSHPQSGAAAVSLLLCFGLAGLFWLRFRNHRSRLAQTKSKERVYSDSLS